MVATSHHIILIFSTLITKANLQIALKSYYFVPKQSRYIILRDTLLNFQAAVTGKYCLHIIAVSCGRSNSICFSLSSFLINILYKIILKIKPL